MLVIITVILILLHGPDGREIRINPDQVTSLRAAKAGEEGKHFTEEIRCMVSLADGKYVTVIEPCATVQRMLENTR